MSLPHIIRGDRWGRLNDNYSTFEDDGTLVFYGDATVFEDIQFPISSGRVGVANFPTWATFTTNTSEYVFDVDDYIDLATNELLHAWMLGTAAELHLHCTTQAANSSGSSQYAKFTLWAAYGEPGTEWLETSFTAEIEIPNGTAALHELYVPMGDLTLTGYGLSARVKLRVKRIAATSGTEYADDIFIGQIGSHIELDTMASRQEATK